MRFLFIFLLYGFVSAQNSKTNMYLSDQLVIAHRGTTFWAPEETEAAMRWARNIGADYLEFDLQRTKDGKLIALHDDVLGRTTDVAVKFPDRKDKPVSQFTYQELLSLDAGSWFNLTSPQNARKSFTGLDILSLEDIIQIAEGKRVSRDKKGRRILNYLTNGQLVSKYETDPADNGNRPGLYIETKIPELFPGIENDLKTALLAAGWYNEDLSLLKPVNIRAGRVQIANTEKRVILQTFSKRSLVHLQHNFKEYVPKCLLLWRGPDYEDIENDSIETFKKHIEFGKRNGATIAGSSIGGKPNNYVDLLSPVHYNCLKEAGFLIHAYSFDTREQFDKYKSFVNGMFTNKSDESLKFYGRLSNDISALQILQNLGY